MIQAGDLRKEIRDLFVNLIKTGGSILPCVQGIDERIECDILFFEYKIYTYRYIEDIESRKPELNKISPGEYIQDVNFMEYARKQAKEAENELILYVKNMCDEASDIVICKILNRIS